MELENLMAYKKAMEIGEELYRIVDRWTFFDKDTLGKQLVRSADSMAGNIAEGYGRYFYKENRQFCYYSRGSMFETGCWIKKAAIREIIPAQTAVELYSELENNKKLLNGYIRSIGRGKIQA